MHAELLHGIRGASEATGPTIVIDTFRAFTTAAVAHDRDVGRHLLVDSVAEARRLAASIDDRVLCGEDRGRKPTGFDLGNSPAEMSEYPIAGRTLIQRSTAGTRSVLAALRAGASPVHPAALVTASAVAAAVAGQPRISIVAAGTHGTHEAPEDVATALFIIDVLHGRQDRDKARRAVVSSPSAAILAAADWAHRDDVDMCSDVDRFPFALAAELHKDGFAEVVRVRSD